MTQRPVSSPRPNAHPTVPSAEPAQQKRTLAVLVVAQVLSGAGLAAGITVGALLAEDMLGATSLPGLPSHLWIAVAGAVGGMASGIVVATTSYATLALLGGLVAATVVPVIAVTSLEHTTT